jgi:predicted ATPase
LPALAVHTASDERDGTPSFANGERQLALVTGEAGLGKSRLLAEASSAAIAQGFEVLMGLCHPGDHAIPFAPFVDAIRQRIGG